MTLNQRVRGSSDAGMAVIERNWRCHAGEVDIVARDGDALVF
ncbi:YraN family protein, partial [Streptomyces microflavus]